MGIIASKSFILSQLLLENMTQQIGSKDQPKIPGQEHKKVIIDFKGQIQF